ncbi:MAG: TIGR03862 family flavoprotein [Hyphomicrobiales bacterium]|nr:TIGR03862 family flavoprotein [Hyphomicrobiales bacterium]
MGRVIVVGAGPAGLMAADVAAAAGHRVTIVDRMASFGRKLLMAGRGGLNLTHTEGHDAFLGRYGAAAARLAPAIEAFPPEALRAFVRDLGEETFVGTSGRVFPCSFKASPLLRAWLRRLAGLGVESRTRLRWTGFADGVAAFRDETGATVTLPADAVVLALGGASWPRLGSDGAWTTTLADLGVEIAPLRPTNCGFVIPWSDVFRTRFEGEPLKRVALRFRGLVALGEAMVTRDGLEGGAIYALSGPLRDAIAEAGPIKVELDLKPGMSADELAIALGRSRKGDSQSNVLRKSAGLPPVAIGLLREGVGGRLPTAPEDLAKLIKATTLTVVAARPIDRAISSAGGVRFDEVDADYMLKKLPGVFVCGEMLDWEAPTGGFLLQASFSTGRAAGEGVVRRLAETGAQPPVTA